MKFLLNITILALSLLSLGSCVDIREYDDSCSGNFEALWNIMDQHYCFFPEKEEALGINWNDIHTEYKAQLNNKMTQSQQFEFLAGMLDKLQDGHVNLSASFDISRSWSWKEDYPDNFYEDLQRHYLGKSSDYKVASGMKYRILDDNVGYLYIGNFENTLGEGNLDEVLTYLAPCDKLILDIRNNGGGMLTEAQKLAARFTSVDVLAGYMRHKTGGGHEDFSDWEPININTSSRVRWNKPVMLLTNRSVYSAANEFTKYMKAVAKSRTQHGEASITVMGDNTGGGSGMPYSNELPNGWTIRLSACPMYDADKQCTEFGIAPDIHVDITDTDRAKGLDTIIEEARKRHN